VGTLAEEEEWRFPVFGARRHHHKLSVAKSVLLQRCCDITAVRTAVKSTRSSGVVQPYSTHVNDNNRGGALFGACGAVQINISETYRGVARAIDSMLALPSPLSLPAQRLVF